MLSASAVLAAVPVPSSAAGSSRPDAGAGSRRPGFGTPRRNPRRPHPDEHESEPRRDTATAGSGRADRGGASHVRSGQSRLPALPHAGAIRLPVRPHVRHHPCRRRCLEERRTRGRSAFRHRTVDPGLGHGRTGPVGLLDPDFELPAGSGRMGHYAEARPQLPSNVASSVEGILGLDTLNPPQPTDEPAPPVLPGSKIKSESTPGLPQGQPQPVSGACANGISQVHINYGALDAVELAQA